MQWVVNVACIKYIVLTTKLKGWYVMKGIEACSPVSHRLSLYKSSAPVLISPNQRRLSPKSLKQVPPPWVEVNLAVLQSIFSYAAGPEKKRRRRWRAGGNWEGVSPFQPISEPGERRELPHQGPGRCLGEKRIWYMLSITEHFCLHDIVNHENSVLENLQCSMP